jgi:hypothetical protein
VDLNLYLCLNTSAADIKINSYYSPLPYSWLLKVRIMNIFEKAFEARLSHYDRHDKM